MSQGDDESSRAALAPTRLEEGIVREQRMATEREDVVEWGVEGDSAAARRRATLGGCIVRSLRRNEMREGNGLSQRHVGGRRT